MTKWQKSEFSYVPAECLCMALTVVNAIWKIRLAHFFAKHCARSIMEKNLSLLNFSQITKDIVNGSDSDAYKHKTLFYFLFTFFRCLQVMFGLYGNVLTLMVLRSLKCLSNGHILMVYLAVFDILVCTFYPLEAYIFFTQVFSLKGPHWEVACIVEEYIMLTFIGGCTLTYVMLSVDRFVTKKCFGYFFFLGDGHKFCFGANGTHILDFWWHFLCVSKSRTLPALGRDIYNHWD